MAACVGLKDVLGITMKKLPLPLSEVLLLSRCIFIFHKEKWAYVIIISEGVYPLITFELF
jgi:hypothetical protein